MLSCIGQGDCQGSTGGEAMTFPGDPGEREDIPVDPMIVSTFAQSFRAMVGSEDLLGLLGD